MITTEERRALLERAITTYGAPAQMDMTVEEMAEADQSPLQNQTGTGWLRSDRSDPAT